MREERKHEETKNNKSPCVFNNDKLKGTVKGSLCVAIGKIKFWLRQPWPGRGAMSVCNASVFIATSLDGFIAKTDGSIDWMMLGWCTTDISHWKPLVRGSPVLFQE
eukprot:s315_g19.t3